MFDVDTDFFLFRVAEAYLNAAEAEMHLNGESSTKAKGYIDILRKRAHTATSDSYNLNYILDERSREFYFEGLRRTDLYVLISSVVRKLPITGRIKAAISME